MADLNKQILDYKRMIGEQKIEMGKMDYKMKKDLDTIEKQKARISELEKVVNDLEDYKNAQNTKLLSSKMSKEEVARKLHECEFTI